VKVTIVFVLQPVPPPIHPVPASATEDRDMREIIPITVARVHNDSKFLLNFILFLYKK
jgi:hypothetical protein